jgi:hypothetical protein
MFRNLGRNVHVFFSYWFDQFSDTFITKLRVVLWQSFVPTVANLKVFSTRNVDAT